METSDNDRRLRVQYPDAIYHVMSRGVQRSSIFLNDEDRFAFFARCEQTVDRFGWLVYAVVQMTNHFHLLFQTPEANLCRGAQYLLGPYAQSFNRRHGRSGHVFEGRYHCRVIEDESYLWTVSRYDHLNPVGVLVEQPSAWPWSSYPGYREPSLRLPWVCYDELLNAWQGAMGTPASYCDYVERGLRNGDENRLPEMIDGWIIGSDSFAERIRKIVSPESREPIALTTRSRPNLTLADVVSAVCQEFEVPPAIMSKKSSRHPARAIAALLAHHHSKATLGEIATALGLADRRSVPQAVTRGATHASDAMRARLALIKRRLGLAQ